MKSGMLYTLLQLAQLAAVLAYTVDPPTSAPADTVEDCTNWHVGAAGDKCADIAANSFIELSQLYSYNPSLAAGCNVVVGTSYCVEVNWGVPPVTSTTSAASTKTSATGVPTPTPTQPGGMIAGCEKFYFVKKDDTCGTVLATTGLTLAQLFALNAGVKADCTGLWLEVYVCVAGPQSSATSTSATVTTTATGLATPTPTQPGGMITNCQKFYFVKKDDTCGTVLATTGLTLAQLFALNAGVKADCTGLWLEVYLCIAGPQSSATSTSASVTTTATGLATPTPTQPGGMISGCQKFYFVTKDDTCATVLTTNGLTLAQLFALNAGVKADCTGLWLEVYVCVAGPQSTATSAVISTTTSAGNGIATPTPTQPGTIASNCNKFYFVQPGSTCSQVLSANGITIAQLFAWNSGVGADCTGMWPSVYLCVGVLGSSTPSSTTSAGNGITTPTPTQPPSIVSNCNKFYFVQPGATCGQVLSANGITIAQLFAWNSGVGADCTGMWPSVYLCVGVIGGSTPTSTTSAGNGIATPTPTQPPSIVSNCKKFYFVQPGATCGQVLSANGITIAQLFAWNSGVKADCTGMWPSVWLCVATL